MLRETSLKEFPDCVAIHHACPHLGQALSDLIVLEPFAYISPLLLLSWSHPLLVPGNVTVSLVHRLLLKVHILMAPTLFLVHDQFGLAGIRVQASLNKIGMTSMNLFLQGFLAVFISVVPSFLFGLGLHLILWFVTYKVITGQALDRQDV